MGAFVDLVDKIRSYGPLEKQAVKRTKSTHPLEEGLLRRKEHAALTTNHALAGV